MIRASVVRSVSPATTAMLGAFLATGCAARGHVATPAELTQLQASRGMSASGKLTLSGPRGKFGARIVFGVAAPDSLRIEIPAGTGLRFLLISRDGKLRAELPGDDASFEGPATSAVMEALFGIDLAPKDLVDALLGSPPSSLKVAWRFDQAKPAQVTMRRSAEATLSIALTDPETEAPPATAFDLSPPRGASWTLQQMSERLGLVR